MRITCTECEAEMVDSILRHTKDCSANNFMPRIGEYQRPPSQTLTFDTPEEQKKWLKKLGTASGNQNYAAGVRSESTTVGTNDLTKATKDD